VTHVNCRLTAKGRDQLRNSTLGSRVWATFTRFAQRIATPLMSLQDLYHETYDCIVVMFASIPMFWEFCRQNAVSRHGIECIRLLNEIICDFDQVQSPASTV